MDSYDQSYARKMPMTNYGHGQTMDNGRKIKDF